MIASKIKRKEDVGTSCRFLYLSLTQIHAPVSLKEGIFLYTYYNASKRIFRHKIKKHVRSVSVRASRQAARKDCDTYFCNQNLRPIHSVATRVPREKFASFHQVKVLLYGIVQVRPNWYSIEPGKLTYLSSIYVHKAGERQKKILKSHQLRLRQLECSEQRN